MDNTDAVLVAGGDGTIMEAVTGGADCFHWIWVKQLVWYSESPVNGIRLVKGDEYVIWFVYTFLLYYLFCFHVKPILINQNRYYFIQFLRPWNESKSGSGSKLPGKIWIRIWEQDWDLRYPVAGITIYYSQASMKVFLDLRKSLQTFRENILVFQTWNLFVASWIQFLGSADSWSAVLLSKMSDWTWRSSYNLVIFLNICAHT
jgi:hypothetical protein